MNLRNGLIVGFAVSGVGGLACSPAEGDRGLGLAGALGAQAIGGANAGSGAVGANGGQPAAAGSYSAAGGGLAGAGTTAGTGGVAGAGGAAGQSGSGSAGSGGTPPGGPPTFVAVGYSGRRVRSIDLGLTWIDEQTLGGGGDDEFLLRGVGFGAGVFVAVGWKILSSADGKAWTEHENPQNQWLQGIQFDGSSFLTTGGYGYAASSIDGTTWTAAESVPNNEASRSLAFGAGRFVTATDAGNWFETTDGTSWSYLSGGHSSTQVAFCTGEFQEYAACSGPFSSRGRATAAGITIRVSGGKLERSTDGLAFQEVEASPSGLEDVVAGYVQ